MNPRSTAAVNAILPLLDTLEREGVELNPILTRAGIDPASLSDARTRLPEEQLEALWRCACRATGDPALALRVALATEPSRLGVVGHLASVCESGRSAYEGIKDLTPLLWENFRCELEADEEVAFVRCRLAEASRPSCSTIEYFVGITIAMSRALGTARHEPLEARFSYSPPPHAAAYERILGLPVRFDAGEDGVLFPAAMMDRWNPAADPGLRQLLEQHAAEQLALLPASASLPQRVRAYLHSVLPLGGVGAEQAAAHFSMSARTLRRRLNQEGTCYQEILDELRAERARFLLCREGRSIEEVAYLLGFSDPSAFTKAFRRWTGTTPAVFARRA